MRGHLALECFEGDGNFLPLSILIVDWYVISDLFRLQHSKPRLRSSHVTAAFSQGFMSPRAWEIKPVYPELEDALGGLETALLVTASEKLGPNAGHSPNLEKKGP